MRRVRMVVTTAVAVGALVAAGAVAAPPASAANNQLCAIYTRAAQWANDVGLGWYTWANTFGSAYAREQGDMYADLAVENYNAAGQACAKGL